MSEFVTSGDGTRIAYDREGEGPAVIFVASAFNFRAFDPSTAQLAHLLAERGFTTVNYDRRGRGESTDTLPFAIEREIDDIAALIDVVGGSAALFGNSSGSALCLWAAAARIGVSKLALWEIPLDLEGEGDGGVWLRGLQERLAAGDREGTVEFYMSDMPPEWLAGAKSSPAWPVMVQNAPTLEYDAAVLERAQHAPWSEQWAAVTVPTLVMYGSETLPIFPPVTEALVAALPDARSSVVDAANHGWAPEVMAAELEAFLR
ncbi:alpha/beta fold hydrolase [Herbiconiux sp. P17]|uniref:alpha/beta fold hydrolase n=1 Tax=Herbiconiux wuyangfengii TaxID=3342794 RepID=UPI0035B9B5AA